MLLTMRSPHTATTKTSRQEIASFTTLNSFLPLLQSYPPAAPATMLKLVEQSLDRFLPTPKLPRAGKGGVDEGGLVLYCSSSVEGYQPLTMDSLAGPDVDGSRTNNVVLVKDLHSSFATTKHSLKLKAVIIDARSVTSIDELDKMLHTAGQFACLKLTKGGRVIVVASSYSQASGVDSTETMILESICEGFVRSLSKELGKQSTCNLVVEHRNSPPSSADLPPPALPCLSYLLSGESAFVTNQRLDVEAGDRSQPPRPLAGKTAIVTGAARGIGYATALSLSQSGVSLVMVDHPSAAQALEESRLKILEASPQISVNVVCCDVTDPAAGSLIAQGLEPDKKVSICVHAAGITKDKTLKRMDFETYEKVMAVNLKAVLSIDDHLLKEGIYDPSDSSVVLLASTSGVAGNFGQTNYAASKAGLMGYAQFQHSKERADGMRWTCVAPGFIESDMTKNLPPLSRILAKRALNPLVSTGLPVDVAGAIRFLASAGGRGVKGRCLRVCGGMMTGR
jgi:3-oxoacyl-[acyl-carrier protein] reductase